MALMYACVCVCALVHGGVCVHGWVRVCGTYTYIVYARVQYMCSACVFVYGMTM